jgi:DNA-binding MarR family transcriptional regulator
VQHGLQIATQQRQCPWAQQRRLGRRRENGALATVLVQVHQLHRVRLGPLQRGHQRMSARVLAAFLFAGQDTLTMRELAEELGVSAGSVSAALKALNAVGLIERVPVPGSRREHYRLRDDAWATLFTSQNTIIQVMMDAAATASPRRAAPVRPGAG